MRPRVVLGAALLVGAAIGVVDGVLTWALAGVPAPAPVEVAPVCVEGALLPEVDVYYPCPAGTDVGVHDSEAGPVLLCLCPVEEAP